MTAAAATRLQAASVDLLVFIQLDLPSGVVRVCSDAITRQWAGNQWLGGAAFTALQPIDETSSPSAAALSLSFSGIDTGFVAAILGDDYQGRIASIWIAPLDDAGVPVEDPVLVFSGLIDSPVIEIGATATVVLNLENRWSTWNTARTRRYNSADQVAEFAGDKGFDYIESIEQAELVWGTFKGPPAPTPSFIQKGMTGFFNAVNQVGNQIGDAIADVFGW
jgi:hypothetical protein